MAGGATAAGEWIDTRHTTTSDTTVWVFGAGGDDELLQIHVSADGKRSETRRHFGRWFESQTRDSAGASVAALCFVRRPGRDAPSCDRFVVSPAASGSDGRTLTIIGYVGAHHTADRVLPERQLRRAIAPAKSVVTDSATASENSSGGGGFHPRAVQPERPSVATHAGTVAAGYIEIESGVERDRFSDRSLASQVPTLIKLGLSSHTQLAIGVPASGATGAGTGFGDLSVGVKWRITEDTPLLQDIALLPSVKFASGGTRGTGTTDANLLLINSRTFGPVSVDLNVGITRRSGDGSNAPRTASMWAVAAGIPVRGAFGWAFECYGYPGTSGVAGSAPIVALLTGPTWVLRPEIALDAGVIAPFAGPQPRAFYAGIVTSVGRVPRF